MFAGQRAEGFYVDLGSIFDLADLRPFENLHASSACNVFSGPAAGVNATNHLNVHSIAIQVPISAVTDARGHPTIGVWTTASRQRVTAVGRRPGREREQRAVPAGLPAGQPAGQRGDRPAGQEGPVEHAAARRRQAVRQLRHPPGLAGLLPVLYPGVFPNLAALVTSGEAARRPGGDPAHRDPLRADPRLHQLHRVGARGHAAAEHLDRGDAAGKQSIYGLLGGDAAGFPNGRRVTDDVVAIELRAIAGVTYPLVDKTYTPDAAAGKLTDGLTPASVSAPYLGEFPYLGVPYSGFDNPS